MKLPRSLRTISRRQGGVFTRAQALDAGITDDQLWGWVCRDHLEVVHDGVYRLPGSGIPDTQHLHAAVLRAGDGACVTGWSACALYGLEGFDLDDVAWVAIPSRRRVRGVEFVVQRVDLPSGQIGKVRGVRATAPHRAVVDAAARVSQKTLRVGIDDGRRRDIIDLDRLLRMAVDLGNHRGAVAVRRLFGSGELDQDGELERKLALALQEVDLYPAWSMEVLPGIKPDASFPEASYALECDSHRWHTIEADRAADAMREGVLRSDGWLVRRIADADLTERREELVAEIEETRAARIAAGAGRPSDWRPLHPGRRTPPPRAA